MWYVLARSLFVFPKSSNQFFFSQKVHHLIMTRWNSFQVTTKSEFVFAPLWNHSLRTTLTVLKVKSYILRNISLHPPYLIRSPSLPPSCALSRDCNHEWWHLFLWIIMIPLPIWSIILQSISSSLPYTYGQEQHKIGTSDCTAMKLKGPGYEAVTFCNYLIC